MFIACAPAMRLSTYGKQRPWIYAVRLVKSNRVKIGFSTDILERLATLKTQFQTDLEVLGLMPGTFQAERALHKTLDASRIIEPGIYECYHVTAEIDALVRRRFTHPAAIYDDTFPVYSTYTPRGKGIYTPLTPSVVEQICYRQTLVQPGRGKSRLLPCLIERIKRERAAGIDTSRFEAIVRDRLGVEVAA